jgi:hypothetical protein
VSYDKVIPPGEEGKIKIKVATKGYGGNKLTKSIHVNTNDPNHSSVELLISGEVKSIATIIPKSVFLSGMAGDSLSQVVKIIPEPQEQFKILKVTALNGADFKYTLKEVENSGSKFYELTIENTRKTPGRYFDTISMITDRSDQTPLTVYVRGFIKSDTEGQTEGIEKGAMPEPPGSVTPEPEVK